MAEKLRANFVAADLRKHRSSVQRSRRVDAAASLVPSIVRISCYAYHTWENAFVSLDMDSNEYDEKSNCPRYFIYECKAGSRGSRANRDADNDWCTGTHAMNLTNLFGSEYRVRHSVASRDLLEANRTCAHGHAQLSRLNIHKAYKFEGVYLDAGTYSATPCNLADVSANLKRGLSHTNVGKDRDKVRYPGTWEIS